MLYAKIPDELGDYVAADGARFSIATATSAQRSPLAFVQFDSLDDCLSEWHLTYAPLPEPEPQPEN